MTFLDVVMGNWWSLILAGIFLVIGIFLLIIICSKKNNDAQRLSNAKSVEEAPIKQQEKKEIVAEKNSESEVKASAKTKKTVVAKDEQKVVVNKEDRKEEKPKAVTSKDVLFVEKSTSQDANDAKKEEVLFADSKGAAEKSTTKKATKTASKKSVSKTGNKTTAKKTSEKKSDAKKTEAPKKTGGKNMEVHEEVVTENYRLTYDKVAKNWVLKKDGAKKATKRFKTKEEATEYAKNISEKHDANLAVHKKDGKFQKKSNI